MYTDEQLLPISALQHLVFCQRQCALIHVEQVWSENALTAEGQLLHRKTNIGRDESRSGGRIVRSMSLVSRRLGVVGVSDVVEFKPPEGVRPQDVAAPIGNGRLAQYTDWKVTPIEYKRGKPKTSRIWGDCDRVQLCAQSLCLEEMLGVTIETGQLFYGENRRRLDVELDAELRAKTELLVQQMHRLLNHSQLPPPVNDRRCKRCSLIEICMPEMTESPNRASRWIAKRVASHCEADE